MSNVHPLAIELNTALRGTVVEALFSDLGKRLYFPKGIMVQSAEAKKLAKKMNATVGIATKGGRPLFLPSIRNLLPLLEPEEVFPYAPPQGLEPLREEWKKEILRKNPDIGSALFSLPMVVPGLTAGISFLADLFVDEGDPVVMPELFWDNYPLIFETRRGARIVQFPFFNESGGFNTKALASALKQAAGVGGKAVLILNFPNNPTGYSLTKAEAEEVVSVVRARAEAGTRMLVIHDDAYFGLFYEPEIYSQSLFAKLCSAHANILAAKIDGSTKEDLTWGFRTGFVTFGAKDLTPEHHDALSRKLIGAIRSSVSNSSMLAQNLILRAIKSPTRESEKHEAAELLARRYHTVKSILANKKSDVIAPLPFNSGYFMSFRLSAGKAEDLRKALLTEHGVGTIAVDERCLRVAYSSVETDQLGELFDLIYAAAEKLR